jgi:hypothetical protein
MLNAHLFMINQMKLNYRVPRNVRQRAFFFIFGKEAASQDSRVSRPEEFIYTLLKKQQEHSLMMIILTEEFLQVTTRLCSRLSDLSNWQLALIGF